jgi:hypothetical protein
MAQIQTVIDDQTVAKGTGQADGSEQRREAWSARMLPWMGRMVLGLTVFFFLASAAQLVYLHYEIMRAPSSDVTVPMNMLQSAQGQQPANEHMDEKLPAAAIAALTALEINAMERRYHQANVSLLSRVWTRYLGFVTGMVLAMVGAAFILGRLETKSSTASAETAAGKFSFQSESPGLILAGLGVALMITTIVTHHEIQVQDRAIYARGWSIGGAQSQRSADVEKPEPLSIQEPEEGAASAGVPPNPALDSIGERIGERGGAGVSR